MIQIIIRRRLDCKQGRGRYHVNPTILSVEPTMEDATAYVAQMVAAFDPDYMPVQQVDYYDHAAWRADPIGAKPIATWTLIEAPTVAQRRAAQRVVTRGSLVA